MIHEIRSAPLLTGVRGIKPADINTIACYLMRLSQMALDFPEIKELDINPLMVGEAGNGAICADCRLLIE